MTPSEYAWGAMTKYRIRGCKHCRGRNSAFDVKANSKRRSELACRPGLRYQQLLHRGVRDSGSTLRLFGPNVEKGNCVPDKATVEDVQGERQSTQQELVASALNRHPDPTPRNASALRFWGVLLRLDWLRVRREQAEALQMQHRTRGKTSEVMARKRRLSCFYGRRIVFLDRSLRERSRFLPRQVTL
jgi:hypothetical protein